MSKFAAFSPNGYEKEASIKIKTKTTMSFGAPVAPTPQLVGSCTAGTTDRLAPADHCVQSAGNDGISSLRWSATANHLVSTNWDGGVRCWEVQEQGGQIRALPKAQGESFIVGEDLLFLFRSGKSLH